MDALTLLSFAPSPPSPVSDGTALPSAAGTRPTARAGAGRATFGMAGAVLSDFVPIGAVALGLGALLAGLRLRVRGGQRGSAPPISPSSASCCCARAARFRRRARGRGGRRSTAAVLLGAPSSSRVTNPKGYLFFSAFLPQFVSAAEPQVAQYLVLALLFAAIDLAVMLAYALCRRPAARFL